MWSASTEGTVAHSSDVESKEHDGTNASYPSSSSPIPSMRVRLQPTLVPTGMPTRLFFPSFPTLTPSNYNMRENTSEGTPPTSPSSHYGTWNDYEQSLSPSSRTNTTVLTETTPLTAYTEPPSPSISSEEGESEGEPEPEPEPESPLSVTTPVTTTTSTPSRNRQFNLFLVLIVLGFGSIVVGIKWLMSIKEAFMHWKKNDDVS